MDLIRKSFAVAKDPYHTKWICPLLVLADAALCLLVVRVIPYTEIDWKTYMQHIAQYLAGERNYVKIAGDTGPLVYPAMHVYIYRLLYAMTDRGQDIALAQYMFIGLYLATLVLVMQCYRRARAPPYLFPLLILSRRLHSIFLLRLFNDCFAVFFLFLAIYFYQSRMWTVGSMVYSAGVGVKMSLLLALPAIAVLLWQGMGRDRALGQVMLMAQLQASFGPLLRCSSLVDCIQMVLALPFLRASAWRYVSRAFEFTRQFLFKWTVNWRFVGEEVFLTSAFSRALLAAHASLLALMLSTRWLHVPLLEGMREFLLDAPSPEREREISKKVTPSVVLTNILSAVTIGCLCARSLHYQFYAYIAWSTPFLLWRSKLHPVLIYGIWVAQEWAWNVYPSSNASSIVVVTCLAMTALSVWLGTESGSVSHIEQRSKQQ